MSVTKVVLDYEVYRKLKKYEEHFNKTVGSATKEELQEGFGRSANEPSKKINIDKNPTERSIDYSLVKYVPKK